MGTSVMQGKPTMRLALLEFIDIERMEGGVAGYSKISVGIVIVC